MPPEIKKSSILSKLGQRGEAAFEKHKLDEVPVVGGSDLPPGVSGIAQLKTCKFALVQEGKTNAGCPFFYAAGIVIEPKTFVDKHGNKHIIEKSRTSITKIIADSPNANPNSKTKTVEACIKWVIDQMQLLAPNEVKNLKFSQLEWFAAKLQEKKPFFKFRTWMPQQQAALPGQQAQEPRVIHTWEGAVELDIAPADPTIGVEDETSSSHPLTNSNPKNSVSVSVPANVPAHAKNTNTTPKVEEPVKSSADDFNEYPTDLGSLLELANSNNDKAKDLLAEMAIKAGHPEDVVTNAQTWEEVVEMIKNPNTTSTEEVETTVESEPEPFVIEVGRMCKYKPFNKLTNKYLEEVECCIEAVDQNRQNVTLKNYDDGKTVYKGVPFGKLIPIV